MYKQLVKVLKALVIVLVGFCLLLLLAGYLWAWAWHNTAVATEEHFREVQVEKSQQDSLRAAATQQPDSASGTSLPRP